MDACRRTTFFLVRHAAHDRLGKVLCGRHAGVGLGKPVARQAARQAAEAAREHFGRPIAA